MLKMMAGGLRTSLLFHSLSLHDGLAEAAILQRVSIRNWYFLVHFALLGEFPSLAKPFVVTNFSTL